VRRAFAAGAVSANRRRYRYTDGDLAVLREALSGSWPNRVLFNNYVMGDDAKRFIRLLEVRERGKV
jgi:hypothetical protein